MSTIVRPESAAESAVKTNESSLPVDPALTRSGVTVIFPIPTGRAAPEEPASASSPSRAASTGALVRAIVALTIDPSARKREAEVKQAARVAVRVARAQHDGDQADAPSVRRGDEAVAGESRPAGLDAVGAAVGAEQSVLVQVDL